MAEIGELWDRKVVAPGFVGGYGVAEQRTAAVAAAVMELELGNVAVAATVGVGSL